MTPKIKFKLWWCRTFHWQDYTMSWGGVGPNNIGGIEKCSKCNTQQCVIYDPQLGKIIMWQQLYGKGQYFGR